ncbi:hypothetical protein [Actinoplanes palleronii]|uniref:Membrane protein YesL n=1 Tax=Actinoplanes palleronii TaxID=113570 RepID=A0ABQ4B5X0_9ACTN|nr:hypothetical protein [Actinoplanes palleronii]GIE66069.1 hypothetical protein Apa02nite_021770 [Actinoplanes palleronii]
MSRLDRLGAVFDLAYLALATNLLLAVSALPVLAAMFGPGLLAILAAPLVAPGLCAAFAVFAAHPGPVVRTFGRAWLASFRRATQLGALATAAVVVLAVDIRAAWGHPAGAAVIPVLVVLIVLVVATTLLGLAALADHPAARLRDVLRASLFLGVRRWYLTLPSLGVLALFEALFAAKPVLALSLAATPLLYAVWANCRFTLTGWSSGVPRTPGGTPGSQPASRHRLALRGASDPSRHP